MKTTKTTSRPTTILERRLSELAVLTEYRDETDEEQDERFEIEAELNRRAYDESDPLG